MLQGAFSVLVFVLLSSQDGFSTEWKEDAKGVLRAPAIYNGKLDYTSLYSSHYSSHLPALLKCSNASQQLSNAATQHQGHAAPAFEAAICMLKLLLRPLML